ncbi:MAG: PaaX family transcriptional regulator C-terminal domain-containing protein [Patescibacteria group bacterium]
MLSLTDKILTLLYYCLENYDSGFEDLYHPEKFIFNSFSKGYHPRTVYQELWKLKKSGALKKSSRDGQTYYHLTATGKTGPAKAIPLLRFQRQWDGKWRIVIFDIDEKHRRLRDTVRTKLRQLGFGLWQRSIWLTPFDVADDMNNFLEKLDLKGTVEVLEAKRLFVSDEKALAAKVWDLPKLNDTYHRLEVEWIEAREQYIKNLPILRKIAASLQNRYLEITWHDPGLPTALLPEPWAGDSVKKLFFEWNKIV